MTPVVTNLMGFIYGPRLLTSLSVGIFTEEAESDNELKLNTNNSVKWSWIYIVQIVEQINERLFI